MPQCLPITIEVINSTTAASREIDFNDTSYMAAVSVPDSHLQAGTLPAGSLLLSTAGQKQPASQRALLPPAASCTASVNTQDSWSTGLQLCIVLTNEEWSAVMLTINVPEKKAFEKQGNEKVLFEGSWRYGTFIQELKGSCGLRFQQSISSRPH